MSRLPRRPTRELAEQARIPLKILASPVTTDRQYGADEIEYMNAVESFKRTTGIKFPTVCQMLAIAKGLGYKK